MRRQTLETTYTASSVRRPSQSSPSPDVNPSLLVLRGSEPPRGLVILMTMTSGADRHRISYHPRSAPPDIVFLSLDGSHRKRRTSGDMNARKDAGSEECAHR